LYSVKKNPVVKWSKWLLKWIHNDRRTAVSAYLYKCCVCATTLQWSNRDRRSRFQLDWKNLEGRKDYLLCSPKYLSF